MNTYTARIGKDDYRVNLYAGPKMSSVHRDTMRKVFEHYLESKEWMRVRMNVLVRDRKKCQECGKKGNVVHHVRYDNWGKGNVEEAMDCILLCGKCHEKVHMNGEVEVPFFAKKNFASKYWEGEIYG